MNLKTKSRTKNVRITLDLPVDLHTKIKTLASQNGETLRQLFIELASGEIANQNNQSPLKLSKSVKKMPKPIPLGVDDIDIQKIIDEATWPKF